MLRSPSGEVGNADVKLDYSDNDAEVLRKPADMDPKHVVQFQYDDLASAGVCSEAKLPEENLEEKHKAESDRDDASSCSSNAHWRGSKRHLPQRLMITHTMGMLPSSALQLIIENSGDIHCHYDLTQVLGKGAFGVVKKGRIKATGAARAVKEILKEKMRTTRYLLQKEIEIMKLIDHPNLLMLHEIFEDQTTMYLVLEMCEGGALDDLLKKMKRFTEKQGALAMQQIIRAVFYLHNHSICHRDMKAENVLVMKKASLEKNTLKVSDFGLSCMAEPKELLNKTAGTPTHMAPEVHAKRYGLACDLWSCGVIAFELLSGHLPFRADSKEELINKVCHGHVSFATDVWLEVSQEALDFVNRLLDKDQNRRLTAQKALKSAFIAELAPKPEELALPVRTLRDLRKFRAQNKLKRAALHVVASMLADEHVAKARKAFVSLDLNGDGSFTIEELKERLRKTSGKDAKQAAKVDEKEVFRDNPTGETELKDFSYTEFLAATFDRKKVMDAGVMEAAFSSFDKNGDGKVSISELATGKLIGKLTMDELSDSLEAIDIDGDGELDYKEFMRMMRYSGIMEDATAAA